MTEKIRTFQAPSMPEALAAVKREMGPEAVILGTRSVSPQGLRGLVARRYVEITAGPPDAAHLPPRAARRGEDELDGLPESVRDYYTRLVGNSVSEEIARRLASRIAGRGGSGVSAATPEKLRARLERFVAAMVPTCGAIALPERGCRRIALIGPSGAGKTTTLAKLAAHFKLKERRSVAVLSIDTLRIGAHEQLERYAQIIGVPFKSAATPEAVRAALADLGGVNAVLIDTPGVGAGDAKRLTFVRELLSAAEVHESHLVLPASMSGAAQKKTAGVFAPFGASRVVLTKLDDAVGFGVILNVFDHLRLDLSYITVGQNVPRDIMPACSRQIAELVLR